MSILHYVAWPPVYARAGVRAPRLGKAADVGRVPTSLLPIWSFVGSCAYGERSNGARRLDGAVPPATLRATGRPAPSPPCAHRFPTLHTFAPGAWRVNEHGGAPRGTSPTVSRRVDDFFTTAFSHCLQHAGANHAGTRRAYRAFAARIC